MPVVRVGVIVMPVRRWAEQARQWRAVEELGFDHAWIYDHLTWDPYVGRPWGATVPTLTAAAAATTRIPLGTWVASPNYRHPVPFARDLIGLDDVSGGRVVLGIGAGGTGADARVLGDETLTPADRAARLEEFVDLLDLVLTQPITTYRGRFYRAVDAETVLPCVQRPRIPFVVAANGPRLMRLAARSGRGWATTGPRAVRSDRPDGVADDDAWWRGVADLAERFEATLAAAGRDPARVDRMLSVDAAPTFALASVDYFVEVVERARALRFTDVVVHWPVPGAPAYDAPEERIEQVAAVLPSLRGAAG